MNKKRSEYLKRWREAHPNYHRDYTKQWKSNHPDLARLQCDRYREKNREGIRKTRQKVKQAIMTHYGNGKCECVICGFSDIRALSLDHINNDGAKQRERRRDSYNAGTHLYRRLRKEGYPEGYQTLCYNCNIIKHTEYLANKRMP